MSITDDNYCIQYVKVLSKNSFEILESKIISKYNNYKYSSLVPKTNLMKNENLRKWITQLQSFLYPGTFREFLIETPNCQGIDRKLATEK